MKKKLKKEITTRGIGVFDAEIPIVLYTKRYDTKTGLWNFLGLDTNFERITGFPYSVFKNNRLSWTKRLHPDDSEGLVKKAKEFEKGLYRSAEFSYRWLHKDGTYHWFVNCATLIHDPNKKHSEIIGSLIDVSVHEKAKKTIQENERHYKKIAELSPYALVVHSDGVFRFLNHTAVELLGVKKSTDVVGKSIFDFIHPDYHETKHRGLKSMSEKREGLPLAGFKIVRADGEIKDVEMASTPFVFEGQPSIQDVVIDITKFKTAEETYRTNAEELERLNKILMKREIQQPLRGIHVCVTSFDEEKSVLLIGAIEVKIQKFSKQYSMLRIIFKDFDCTEKDWQFSEISELLDVQAEFDWKKLYNIADAIRKNIAIETGIKDFFILTTQSLKINPSYLKKS